MDELTKLLLTKVMDIPTKREEPSLARESDFVIGKTYLIRTVTMIQVGRIKKISDRFITLEDASWVADTKRFYNVLKGGFSKEAEIEPFINDAIVGLGAIIDATQFTHILPTKQQ